MAVNREDWKCLILEVSDYRDSSLREGEVTPPQQQVVNQNN